MKTDDAPEGADPSYSAGSRRAGRRRFRRHATADGGESRSPRAKLKGIEAGRGRRPTSAVNRAPRTSTAGPRPHRGDDAPDTEGLDGASPPSPASGAGDHEEIRARPIRLHAAPRGSGGRPCYEVSATANPSMILGAVVPALLPPATGPRGSGGSGSHIGGDPEGLLWVVQVRRILQVA